MEQVKSTFDTQENTLLNIRINKNKLHNNLDLKRGMIVFADLGGNKGSIQSGKRPVLICSNDMNNKYSSVLTVIPLTSKMSKRPLPTHVELNSGNTPCLKFKSIALCEQIITLPKDSIEYVIGNVSEEIMSKINYAIMVQLAL